MMSRLRASIFSLLILAASACPSYAAQKWLRISSAHFSVLTDAGESKGSEVALRLEQMRSVFAQLLMRNKVTLSQPLDIIAFATDAEYFAAAPLHQGQPISNVAFLLPGEDRNYVGLNLAAPESWRAVQYELAHIFMRYNYPPAPSWFDEGMAAYFSSLELGEKQSSIGGDPESFASILNSQSWMPLPALFSAHSESPAVQPQPPHDLFHAQSWILMHYVIAENKLSETGACLGYMALQKLPVEEAIQKAYGLSASELEQKVKQHLQSVAAPSVPSKDQKSTPLAPGATQITPPGRLEVGTSRKDVPAAEGDSLVAELMLRVPEHRPQAQAKLEALLATPETDTAIAHRALGWLAMQSPSGKDDAQEEFGKALDLDSRDPWTHYYLALMKYKEAQAGGQDLGGLPNMMQDLRITIDWNEDFAEAYNMLAMARLQGGGTHSALEAMRVAIQLSPRNRNYLLNLAQIQLAGKQWDQATALLQQLSSDSDTKIAAPARQYLEDLPTLKKYGLLPQHPGAKPAAPTVVIGQKDTEDSEDDEDRPAEPPPPDKRKTLYLKGKLLGVDCSAPPAATLTIMARGRRLKLRTSDAKSLLLMGADAFSCEWKGQQVVANYKPGGKADGDLVSLEIE